MSITPQFLSQLRDRVPLSEIVGRFVTWDNKKTNQGKGDYWAPCPFHNEKTASFHVDDKKGYYYCFGCHEKGDAINFLQSSAKMEFVEAVKEIASMAGIEMPSFDPKSKEKADKNTRLIDAHNQAAKYYRLQFTSNTGALALNYMQSKRQISNAVLEKFQIGFAPNARRGLTDTLIELGFSEAELIEAGLTIKSDRDGAIFDRFRNRIMFPIRDRRGKVIAFGGRALDETQPAKYLNSPETPIFHKGATLYNVDIARNFVSNETPLIIAEGYMDVIALHQHGFHHAIAPLGTAITELQLEMIWNIHGSPFILLDGDKAGQRAADKLAHLALSKLDSHQTLRFITLPDGMDPDDLLQKEGQSKLNELMKTAEPMVDRLFKIATNNITTDTPEERAKLDHELRIMLKKIKSKSLFTHYTSAFQERRLRLFNKNSSSFSPKQYGNANAPYQFASPKKNKKQNTSKLITDAIYQDNFQIASILLALVNHDELVIEFLDDIALLKPNHPKLKKLRDQLLESHGQRRALLDINENFDKSILDEFKLLPSISWSKATFPLDQARVMIRDELNARIVIKEMNDEIRETVDQLMIDSDNELLTEHLQNLVQKRYSNNELGINSDDSVEEASSYLRNYLESGRWRK